jgi:hypothetical protein
VARKASAAAEVLTIVSAVVLDAVSVTSVVATAVVLPLEEALVPVAVVPVPDAAAAHPLNASPLTRTIDVSHRAVRRAGRRGALKEVCSVVVMLPSWRPGLSVPDGIPMSLS